MLGEKYVRIIGFTTIVVGKVLRRFDVKYMRIIDDANNKKNRYCIHNEKEKKKTSSNDRFILYLINN